MTIVLLPLGSHEQHGPHLPWHTDTVIACAVAQRAADRMADPSVPVYVAPALAYGASWEHHGFAGLLSINDDLVHDILVELARSTDGWADGIVLVNGHGGNVSGVRRAVATITGEGRRALAWWPRVDGGDAHAGRTETSLMLACAPEAVRLELAAAGWTGEVDRRPVRELSANGVLGDPTGAAAEDGEALLDRLGDDLAARVVQWARSWRGEDPVESGG